MSNDDLPLALGPVKRIALATYDNIKQDLIAWAELNMAALQRLTQRRLMVKSP